MLFWLSLVPFTTAWISDRDDLTSQSAAAYGVVAFMGGVSWLLLKTAIVTEQGPNSALKAAYGADWKGRSSGLLTLLSIPLAFVQPYLSIAMQVVVVMWIIPGRRIESRVGR